MTSNRPRVGGVRNVYEEFVPESEIQPSEESHVILVRLPGFKMGEIKVRTETQNVVRVSGQRLVGGNKWSRFQKDFQVPEKCNIESTRVHHQGGNITITIEKKIDNKSEQKTQEAIATTADGKQQDDKVHPKYNLPDKNDLETPIKSTEKRGRRITSYLREAENVASQEAVEKKEGREYKRLLPVSQREAESKLMENNGINNLHKSKKLPNNEYEDLATDTDEVTGSRAHDNKESRGTPVTRTSVVEFLAFKMGNYRKAMKGILELNEERQLLVNVGVAVLVIVVLVASITNNFTSKEAKH